VVAAAEVEEEKQSVWVRIIATSKALDGGGGEVDNPQSSVLAILPSVKASAKRMTCIRSMFTHLVLVDDQIGSTQGSRSHFVGRY